MGKQRTVTGVESAFVRLDTGATDIVRHGQPLPDNLADGEVKRLTELGVFADAPRRLTGRRPPVVRIGTVRAPADLADPAAPPVPPGVDPAAEPDPAVPVDIEQFATGSGWYELPDGSKHRGEDAARQALVALEQPEE
jgi:hypothetical protein